MTKKKIKQFFKLGCVVNVSPDFRVPVSSTTLAKELVDIMGKYHDFDPKKVKTCLDFCKGKVSGYELGREGSSPVIYIKLPFWEHQREEKEKIKKLAPIPADKRRKLIKEIRQVFENVGRCSTFDVLSCRHIRIWWA